MVAQNHALVITELPGRLRIKKKKEFFPPLYAL